MSYSAFFTAGLTLASHPREYEYSYSKLPPLQINVHPGTPRRTRKRRSSLTVATSPIATIKSPVRTANDVARSALRTVSPRDSTFREALQNGTRPRRKIMGTLKGLPSLPAPTSPLPTIPTHRVDLPWDMPASPTPVTPMEDAYPSSPITTESPRHACHPGTLRSNPARKSSFLLPMVVRSALSPSAYAGNIIPDNNLIGKDPIMDIKMAPSVEWYEDEVDMKENDGDI